MDFIISSDFAEIIIKFLSLTAVNTVARTNKKAHLIYAKYVLSHPDTAHESLFTKLLLAYLPLRHLFPPNSSFHSNYAVIPTYSRELQDLHRLHGHLYIHIKLQQVPGRELEEGEGWTLYFEIWGSRPDREFESINVFVGKCTRFRDFIQDTLTSSLPPPNEDDEQVYNPMCNSVTIFEYSGNTWRGDIVDEGNHSYVFKFKNTLKGKDKAIAFICTLIKLTQPQITPKIRLSTGELLVLDAA